MLSRVVLSAAAAAGPSLKNAALLGPGVLQATRIFHTGQPSLAPVPPLPEYGGKVRHGLIPEEFFQFLYPKTGVTGPYVLGTGLILYFLSKEIYVVTPETISAISTIGLLVFMVKKYGAAVGEFADKLNEQKIAQLEEAKQASIKGIQDAIDLEKSQQALVQKRHYLFDVQRNNIAMALEVTYRERLHRVYKEVKNRLDYHISVQNMMRRKEQEHMINWVEKHVVQSISAQQAFSEGPSSFSRENSMGGSSSQPKCDTAQTTPATAAPCTCDYPKKELQLVLAFLAGILLALLLMTIVLLIIKCYRKCHSSRQALDPHSDSLAEFPSSPDKALTSAGMDFKISEGTTDQCRANYAANTDTVVYAQVV